MADDITGIANPTKILESFKNEALKIVNDVINQQAEQLTQGIIRDQVTDHMKTLFNSGYVQQSAASAFNSTIYPEYIRRLKNLEAFLKVSAEQDNDLKAAIQSVTTVSPETANEIMKKINEWAFKNYPQEQIKALVKSPTDKELETVAPNGINTIIDIIQSDKNKEEANIAAIKEANTNNVEKELTTITQNPLISAAASAIGNKIPSGTLTSLASELKGGNKRWSLKYKRSINCNKPKGFSQKQYCKRIRATRRKIKK